MVTNLTPFIPLSLIRRGGGNIKREASASLRFSVGVVGGSKGRG